MVVLKVLAVSIAIVSQSAHGIRKQTDSESIDTGRSSSSELLIIDKWLESHTRQTFLPDGAGLLQTFGPNSFGGGSCGDKYCKLPDPCPGSPILKCRFDVYDNSLAAMYFVKRGKLGEAKRILDAFIYYLYPGRRMPLSYGPDELPSKQYLTLLAAAYTSDGAQAGEYSGHGVADGAVDLGNNAYAGMAFAKYAAATGSSCYATVAHDLITVLSKNLVCDDVLGGYMGRLLPWPRHYRSIEHNIDMYAFARMLNQTKVQSHAAKFVRSMWGKDPKYPTNYAIGTSPDTHCNMSIGLGPTPSDSVLWNSAAGADTSVEHLASALKFAIQTPGVNVNKTQGMWESNVDLIGKNGSGMGEKYHGFRFSNWGRGIQWEISASGAIGMVQYMKLHGEGNMGLADKITKVRESLSKLLKIYGVIPASILGGNRAKYLLADPSSDYPGGSHTGMGWSYFHYPHLASTMWTGLVFIQQSREGGPIDDEGNAYAPPAKPVPTASGDLSCVSQRLPPPIHDAACSKHPKCAGLQGECCPTPAGLMLGCC